MGLEDSASIRQGEKVITETRGGRVLKRIQRGECYQYSNCYSSAPVPSSVDGVCDAHIDDIKQCLILEAITVTDYNSK